MRTRFTLLVLLLLTSCALHGWEQEAEQVIMADNDLVQLAADLSIEGQDLVLRYRVVNNSHDDLYLLNRLYRTTPEWKFDPDVIYVHLDSESRSIWLNKKLADIPSQVLVNSPVAPFVSPVRANGHFEETVRIPLPVQDYRQYGLQAGGPSTAALKAEPVEVVYDTVFFSLGYYWKIPGTEEEIRDVQGTEVVFPVAPKDGGFAKFGALRSETWQISVPVFEHREPVETP